MRGLHRRLIRSQSVRQSILHLTARGRKCRQKDSLKSYLKHREKSMTNSICSHRADHMERITMIESISAVTLATHNMPHAVRFYRVLGFEIVHGDDNAAFTRFRGESAIPILQLSQPSGIGPGRMRLDMNQLPPQRLHGSGHGGIHEKTFGHYGAVLFSGHRFHRSSRGTAGWLYQRCDCRRYRWSFHGTRRNWGGRRV